MLKGSRTYLSLILTGLLVLANHFGWIPSDLGSILTEVLVTLGLFYNSKRVNVQ